MKNQYEEAPIGWDIFCIHPGVKRSNSAITNLFSEISTLFYFQGNKTRVIPQHLCALVHKLLSRLQTMASTSSESVEKELCKLVVTHKDGNELHVKLCVTTWVNKNLHAFFRTVEEYIYGEEVPAPIEITVITDSGMRVVLDECKTPKESWDAKPDKEYLTSVRELEDDSDEYDPYTGMPVGPHGPVVFTTNEEVKKK